MQLGQRNRRVGREDPQELDRPGFGVAEDFHGVGMQMPVRDFEDIDFPEVRQPLDVGAILPVEKEGKLAVATGLTRVLRGGLAIHLQHAAAGPADLAQDKIHIVHLARGRGCLVRLIHPLQHRRHQGRRGAEHCCRLAQPRGRYARDLFDALRWIGRDNLGKLCESLRMLVDERFVDLFLGDQQMQNTIEEGEVRPQPWCKVNVGGHGRRCGTRIDDD